jgi:hypothetical protein
MSRRKLHAGKIIIALFVFNVVACNNHEESRKLLQKKIDSLQNSISQTYKPGLGEFMSDIQAHHSKLWFAGKNQNWKLADFEVHEIMEAIEDIQQYDTARKESKTINMIGPVLDSVSIAIQQKNAVLFKSTFTLLTNTCNNCHRAVNFEFNVVKIPETESFGNQDFKVK